MGIKYILLIIPVFAVILISLIIAKGKEEEVPLDPLVSFYDLNALLISGQEVSMNSYKGKKNTYC